MKSAEIRRTRLPHPKIGEEVRELASVIDGEAHSRQYPALESYTLGRLKQELSQLFNKVSGLSLSSGDISLQAVPPNHKGDYSFQIPSLMKTRMKEYRGEFLPRFAEHLSAISERFTFAKQVGPFLNFSLAPGFFAQEVLREIEEKNDHYGRSSDWSGKKVLVEYSSPNIGKSLHVGHLGTTLVGQALANLYSSCGASVYRINHLGDWGTPVGMLQVGSALYSEDEDISPLRGKPSSYYSAIYARFGEKAKEDPALRERAKEAFAALERNEEEARIFWEKVRSESTAELDQIYSQLGIQFDGYLGESFYESDLAPTLKQLTEHGLAEQDEEALVVDLDDVKLKRVLLRKSDGATTYFARDVCALIKRKELFDFDLCLYVVGAEQTLHFRQLFELAKRMGKIEPDVCFHIPIGLITQKGAKISSRAGGTLAAEELRDAIIERAFEQVSDSFPEEPEEERREIARMLGTGALYYQQLLTTPGKSTEFDLDKILDMRGKSAAYIQYACVRGKSILRKIGLPSVPLSELQSELFAENQEKLAGIVGELALLPEVVANCCEIKSPHPLAHALHRIATELNQFYQRVRIKDLESPEKDLFLHLLLATVQGLENGLALLNIEVPEKM